MKIREQVQEIIDSRKGQGKYQGNGRLATIQQKLTFVEQLEKDVDAFEEFLNQIKSDIQQSNGKFADLVEKQPQFANRLLEIHLHELKQKIAAQKNELHRLQNRFSRDSVQVAFIGQARQGKSSFLQRISGLNDDTIPSSSATDCTGAISIISNYNGTQKQFFEVEIEYYSALEFIAAVNNKLSQLFPQVHLAISSLQEIPSLAFKSEFQNIDDDEVRNFKETYIDSFHIYSPLLGHANEVKTDEKVVAELVAKYKMYKSEKDIPQAFQMYRTEKKTHSGDIQVFFCKYVAVKVAYIKKKFPYADAGNIVLVDTIGLGNAPTEMEDKAKMFDVLKNESDAAVYIYKPSEDGASKNPKAEAALLSDLQSELRDYEPNKWLIGVINKKSEEKCAKKGDEYKSYLDYLESIKRTFSGEQVLAWCEIVDAMSEQEVTDKLLVPLLQTIITNIDAIDSSFMIKADAHAEALYQSYMEICGRVNMLSALFVTNENKKAIFDYQYENLLLKGQLRAYVDGLYAHVSEPSLQMIDDLTPFVEDVINYIPKVYEIENKLNQGGQYAWSENVYSLYMDNIRSQILSSIKQVSSRSVKTIQSKVQDDIIRLLFDAGALKQIKLKSVSSNMPTKEWFIALIAEKLKLYPTLSSAFQTVADFEMRIEGFLYSKCICACDMLRPEKTKLPPMEEGLGIEDKAIVIQQALYAVILEVQQKLYIELGLPIPQGLLSADTTPIEEISQPNLIMWCMADTFQQEIRNGLGAKELEDFYWENANAIWHELIVKGEQMHETATEWNAWANRLDASCEINNFKIIH